MKNLTLMILIALILSNCQKTEIDCSKKESYLEKHNFSGEIKSIKSQVFELIRTKKGNYINGLPKLVSYGNRYYKEFNQDGYIINSTYYEKNSKEIKSKSINEFNTDNINTGFVTYDKNNKVTFKRVIDVRNNLPLKMTDYNANNKVESYYENELNSFGQIIKQIQYRDINKKQKKYLMLYEYENCDIHKYKILDKNDKVLSDIEYKYDNNVLVSHLSKDKPGLNDFIIKRNEIKPNNFKSVKTDGKGIVISEKLVWTDNFNNVIKEIEKTKDTLKNIYTYDRHNNWITMKCFKNNKSVEIVIRDIEYYK